MSPRKLQRMYWLPLYLQGSTIRLRSINMLGETNSRVMLSISMFGVCYGV